MSSILDAVRNGTRLEVLVALREAIAFELDSGEASARDMASLSLRLMDIDSKIRELDPSSESADFDTSGLEDSEWEDV